MEPVIRPTIETASADGTNVVSAMSEVTDNDSVEIDMFGKLMPVPSAAAIVANVRPFPRSNQAGGESGERDDGHKRGEREEEWRDDEGGVERVRG